MAEPIEFTYKYATHTILGMEVWRKKTFVGHVRGICGPFRQRWQYNPGSDDANWHGKYKAKREAVDWLWLSVRNSLPEVKPEPEPEPKPPDYVCLACGHYLQLNQMQTYHSGCFSCRKCECTMHSVCRPSASIEPHYVVYRLLLDEASWLQLAHAAYDNAWTVHTSYAVHEYSNRLLENMIEELMLSSHRFVRNRGLHIKAGHVPRFYSGTQVVPFHLTLPAIKKLHLIREKLSIRFASSDTPSDRLLLLLLTMLKYGVERGGAST